VFKRPLSDEAIALVFFSRRTDMPYHYHASLAQLNFSHTKVYEVSAPGSELLASGFLGRALLGVVLIHM
jgi:alpha-N-acetylgalactosaminidase